MSKSANHYLSLQRVIIFLLVEGLKYFENYQSMTPGHKAGGMVGKMVPVVACHRMATDLQCVTNTGPTKCDKAKHNEMRCACRPFKIKGERMTFSGKQTLEELITGRPQGWASLIAQLVKNPPAKQAAPVRFLGWEDPLKEGMATHTSTLAWRILTNRGSWWAIVYGVAKNWTQLSDYPGDGDGIPLQYSCLENPMDGGAWWQPGGLPSMGPHGVRHD